MLLNIFQMSFWYNLINSIGTLFYKAGKKPADVCRKGPLFP